MPEKEPDLYEQTMELGKSLKAIADRDPDGKPTERAAAAFKSWIITVGSSNREPRYFEDVAENYDISANSNRDLLTIFEMLHPYVDFPEIEEDEPGVFIGLPMA
jgi:hypothetical protein